MYAGRIPWKNRPGDPGFECGVMIGSFASRYTETTIVCSGVAGQDQVC